MSHFDDLGIDHIGYAVGDLDTALDLFTGHYGLDVYARSPQDLEGPGIHSVAVGLRDIRVVLTAAEGADHHTAAYVGDHGDGVSDIAFSTKDTAAAFRTAVGRGARPVAEPEEHDGVITASIAAFGDVVHTFVQRTDEADPLALPGLAPVAERRGATPAPGIHTVDHFAVCLEAGRLDPTVDFYRTVLDFEMVFTERIVVGGQAMESKVVQSPSGAVTLTLIEPDLSREPGQIDTFLKNHGGAGIQHIAFATDDIVDDVGRLTEGGIGFLTTPGTYYDLVPERLTLARHALEELRSLSILVDEDQDGQLLQIFTKSVHPRATLFFEIIERLGAKTFGNGNIKALYTAVEMENARAERDGRP
ncbi:4-hydroxyphenylpyruvate dioxygenase [Streptomyces tsukubensis]|uniref:4-hydroxyphenylpyruvate dioxygenase n=1 Tax=Streptomyces tsukubensis TaxID=83656 RepID=A0A1V4A3C4_9ACTN|nr:4-hydroxyphenylpyruvate dioxygenase [Streptomyces tsukubensis]OON73484.1 4-hydroxyphenylpyruvate dioxygenase [Streptomyces tsukubensis]QFR96725.1 4-hydroxyphenylpyruvate dioxygenase [Streptomyces tsukubensis]